MAGKEISKPFGAVSGAVIPFPWEAIHEINERCLELLAHLARSDASSAMLRPTLRELLRQATPEVRKRAAARGYLLVDFEFRNRLWWEAVRRSPEKTLPGTAGRSPIPKRSAVALTRTLLVATREAIRADEDIARLMLCVDSHVAELISGLQIAEIDRIAERHFRRLEPRWLDRPILWRSLLLAAASPGPTEVRRFDPYCLQLLTGDLLPDMEAPQTAEQVRQRSTHRQSTRTLTQSS